MVQKSLQRWRTGGVAVVLLGVLVVVLLSTENSLPARDEAKPAALPADLARIPSDSVLVFSVRVADLWASALAKPVRKKMAKDIDKGTGEFEKMFGFALGQVERFSVVMLDPPPSREEPLLFFRTSKPLDEKKVLAALGEKTKKVEYKDHTYFVGNKSRACLFLDKQSVVFRDDDELRKWLDRTPKTPGVLSETLRLAAGKQALTLGVNVKAINEAVGAMLPEQAEPFKPLLEAKAATLVVNLADVRGTTTGRANVSLSFPTEESAKAALKPLKAGLDLGIAGLDKGMEELAKEQEMAKIVELLKSAQASLKATKIEQDGKTLRASASAKLDADSAGVVFAEAVQKIRAAAARTQSSNNLKQIALAMHNFHDANGKLPARATFDKNGKPMLSWRVMILPYIEQDALYKEFKLDEPWDSKHNIKLLDKMPKIYASPQDEECLKKHVTHYQGFVGKGVFFEGKMGLNFPADFPDGTSNTLMIVEARKAVPWTKPEDLPYDANKPLPKLGLPGAKGFLASLCDGSVRFMSDKVTEKTLRYAITRNDGEVLGEDF
jgi:hypothetical protein